MIKCDLKRKNLKCGCGCTSTTFKWINENKKSIFFEIPKNASTSIKQLLKKNEFKLLKEKVNYNNYFKFAFIRNPWDRVMSNWKMFCSSSGRWIKSAQLKALFGDRDYNKILFPEFIEIIQTVNNHHWEQQIEYLKDEDDNIIIMDVLGRFENLFNDFKKIKMKLNLNGTLGKINVTNHKDYQHYYNLKEIELIEKKYEKDIEEFGYTF